MLVLAGFFLFFFRDPDRVSPSTDSVVLSPADGRVLVAGPAVAEAAPPGSWQQVSIFLSPMDVHVNRIPASGRVTRVEYKPGRFLPAYRHDAGGRQRAERDLDRPSTARRSSRGRSSACSRGGSCAGSRPATDVRAGDRFGIMKFGSRMDVFLPPDATLMVKVGDAVRGGETVIAMLH